MNLKKEEKQKIKETYRNNIINTLNNIKESVDYITEDIAEKPISNIRITIDIRPGEIVNWYLDKTYNTFTKDKNDEKQYYAWK